MKIEKILLNVLAVQKSGVTCIPKSQFVDYPMISFSGTQNLRHVLNYDLNFLESEWKPKGKVHSGFVKRSIKLMEKIEYFIEENDDFILSGHSLGGAVAVLCASRITTNGKNVVGVYTFGTPKIGNEDFKEYYIDQNLWEKTKNYVTPRDFVKKLPPFIYKNIGDEIELYSSEKNLLTSHDIKTYYNFFHNFS